MHVRQRHQEAPTALVSMEVGVMVAKSDSEKAPVQLQRRREASLRLPPLRCGRRDPWTSRRERR